MVEEIQIKRYFDENNNVVGIDIDRASKILNLSDLEITSVPAKKLIRASLG